MGRFTDVADALEAKLLAIVDPNNASNVGEQYIGKIHKGNPYTDNWGEYLEKNTVLTINGVNAVRVWIINRTQVADTWITQTQTFAPETWILEGWFGYVSGDLNSDLQSEPEFQDWLDTVFDKLRSDYRMGDNFDTRQPPTTQPDIHRLLRYGNVLCHHVEITFSGEDDKTF
ncbi:MAG: hypothetical protein ACYS1A_19540 [Planctomycetota bacterium]|jgi:hypothetical protein